MQSRLRIQNTIGVGVKGKRVQKPLVQEFQRFLAVIQVWLGNL